MPPKKKAKTEQQKKIEAAESAMSAYLNSNNEKIKDTLNKIPLEQSLLSNNDSQVNNEASKGEADQVKGWTDYLYKSGASLFVGAAAGVRHLSNYTNQHILNIKALSDSRKQLVERCQDKLADTDDDNEKLELIKNLLVDNMKLTSYHLENPKNISLHSLLTTYDPHSGTLAKTLRKALDMSEEDVHVLCEERVSQIEAPNYEAPSLKAECK